MNARAKKSIEALLIKPNLFIYASVKLALYLAYTEFVQPSNFMVMEEMATSVKKSTRFSYSLTNMTFFTQI